jgi:glucose-1-phosphate cytidylyltransferase
MVEIGGRPILWHVMKIYSAHGINDFIICAGYKGYMIKEYFANYFMHMSDVTFDMKDNRMEVHQRRSEPWRVTVVDTGEQTMTGGRLLRVRDYIQNEAFCFTYGDGVSDVNIRELVAFHQRQGKQATVTAVQPQSRYGALRLDARNFVEAFEEKPYGEGAWINGGFFVLEPTVLKLITDDTTVWERGPLETLAHSGQLTAHKHHGFWQPMDTLREKTLLENLWAEGNAPWKVW